jgi:Domain of unknown function (DUF2383)
MARMINDVVALLNRLIQLDHSAVEAYKIAVTRLDPVSDRAEIGTFLADHRRHVDELGIVVRNLGGEPVSPSDLRQVLARGRVDLSGLTGEGALVEAMRKCEAETTTLYEDAVSQPGIPVDVLAVLERNLVDERKHHAWILARLETGRSA